MAQDLSAYQQLESRFRRLGVLTEVSSVLEWDGAVMMPLGAGGQRGDVAAEMAGMKHEFISDPAIASLLDEAEANLDQLTPWQAANLREMRNEWVEATAVPGDLVAALAKQANDLELKWRDARAASDFDAVAAPLAELLSLTKQQASAVGDAKGLAPYDALMGMFSPGQTRADVDPLFDDYAAFLPEFLPQVLEHQASLPDVTAFDGPLDVDQQHALSKHLLGQIGFDFDRGRLDTSEHPFCSGTRDDIRMTGRYRDDELGIMAPIHECGHAIYEKQLPKDWAFQPVGQSLGMAIHESQSLLHELQVARSPAYIHYLSSVLPQYLGDQDAWEFDALTRRLNRVERSYIRVDADEVTYPAHVILRYRLEQAMMSGDLAVTDLPGAWSDGLHALLGIRPRNHAEGCLQDIHWFAGLMGYFPSYSLGAMIAAQMFQAARTALPGLDDDLEVGDFSRLRLWLAQNIHEKGRLMSPPELIESVTGAPLDIEIFKNHLKARYLPA